MFGAKVFMFGLETIKYYTMDNGYIWFNFFKYNGMDIFASKRHMLQLNKGCVTYVLISLNYI